MILFRNRRQSQSCLHFHKHLSLLNFTAVKKESLKTAFLSPRGKNPILIFFPILVRMCIPHCVVVYDVLRVVMKEREDEEGKRIILRDRAGLNF